MEVKLRTALRYQRESAGKLQKDAADVIGVTPSQYGKIERGQLRLMLDDAIKLARWLGCRVEDLAD
jgi:DNA-binding XRE family transcriptional regulator